MKNLNKEVSNFIQSTIDCNKSVDKTVFVHKLSLYLNATVSPDVKYAVALDRSLDSLEEYKVVYKKYLTSYLLSLSTLHEHTITWLKALKNLIDNGKVGLNVYSNYYTETSTFVSLTLKPID